MLAHNVKNWYLAGVGHGTAKFQNTTKRLNTFIHFQNLAAKGTHFSFHGLWFFRKVRLRLPSLN